MIWQDTFLTFVDLSRFAVPLDEFSRIVRTKRSRIVGSIRLERLTEGRQSIVYCVILKSGFSTVSKTGNNSMVVYYLELSTGAVGSQHDQVAEILNQNHVKLLDTLPDPASSGRDNEKLSGSPAGILNKNLLHEYIEKKIKEIGRKF